MASAFAHALTAITIGKIQNRKKRGAKFWLLGIVCSILPDADVITFKYGIPYESFWGHRGFTHSFVFAALLAFLVVLIFYSKTKLMRLRWWALWLYFFLATASHSILDAMTTGGRGVAFFSPFDNERYFLPWRLIKVSPVSASRFFSEWGLQVLKSEFLWVGLPCFFVLGILFVWRKG